jgi:circadian clock protein KaiC
MTTAPRSTSRRSQARKASGPSRAIPSAGDEPAASLDATATLLQPIEKAPTGMPGFDEITSGGLPRGRPTLLCGGAGCGKTLFSLHFLVRGAVEYGEPGVFLAFEEREQDLIKNVASLGFDLADLVERKLIALDHIHVDRMEIEESGEYDLEGLFLRLEMAINQVGAKRVVIDTLETIFGSFSNQTILRSELNRLFSWLKERELTTIITGERGDGALTRRGLEEYVSDCVVLLDHRVRDQISTRRVRVVKYRGTSHETNEFPFLIDETGITVVPITSMALTHPVSQERVSSGVRKLDSMLGGNGYYRGSTILVSGTAGTGKSSLCAHFADATCSAGQRCLYVSYEESPRQIQRNMSSIGLDLSGWVEQDLLRFLALRSTSHGFEAHLALLHKFVREFQPAAVILDPVGTLLSAGEADEAQLMLVRIIDTLKAKGITTLLTNLTHGGEALEQTMVGISSLADSWLLLKNLETNGERNRCLYVLKSRGMAHSNQIREFLITADGIDLIEPYIGPEGVLTGTARANQELRERIAQDSLELEEVRRQRLLEHKRVVLEQRIAALRAEFEAEATDLEAFLASAHSSQRAWASERERVGRARGASNKAPESARVSTASPAPAALQGSNAQRKQKVQRA